MKRMLTEVLWRVNVGRNQAVVEGEAISHSIEKQGDSIFRVADGV